MSVLEGAIAIVDAQRWLDRIAEPLQGGLTSAFEAGGAAARHVKNFLHGTWLGHPLHPVLTDVPIGAWSAAMVLDEMAAGNGRRLTWAADITVALGVAGAVGAAVTGITDWQHTNDRPRRLGLVHGMLNTAALGLYVTSLVLRRRGARDAGRATSVVGFGVMLAAAYLGGHLVYRERIGVDHAGERAEPRDFVPVLPESELREGEPRRAEADGVRVLLVKRHGRIFALGETCAHLGGPLAEGNLEDESIRCPWHGSRFALEDGRVLDGPATFPQPCLDARVKDGQIEVRARS